MGASLLALAESIYLAWKWILTYTWKNVMPTEELIAKNEKAKREWILEVDLENPVDLHKDHNG